MNVASHPSTSGPVSATAAPRTLPGILLRLEGAAVLAAAIALYAEHGASWWLFALLLFAPDLSMVGYAGGARVGAMAYNLAHTTVLPIALATVGVLAGEGWAVTGGLIWLAHIGLDRMIGYGLKYPEGFKATHLARV